METLIKEKLKDIEREKGIYILYACETGSRAWGFASPDSDYDVRFIYKHKTDWYLDLNKHKDSIDVPINNDLDITGWDLRKSLNLLKKSNASLFERIQSPIVYLEKDEFLSDLKKTADLYFSPIAVMHHYHNMAKGCYDEYKQGEFMKLKKLFYTLRTSLCGNWILKYQSIPPLEFHFLVEALVTDQYIKSMINDLLDIKKEQGESYLHPSDKKLDAYIDNIMQLNEDGAGNLPGSSESFTALNNLFKKYVL